MRVCKNCNGRHIPRVFWPGLGSLYTHDYICSWLNTNQGEPRVREMRDDDSLNPKTGITLYKDNNVSGFFYLFIFFKIREYVMQESWILDCYYKKNTPISS